ncbi:acyl-CoA dehydrogenase family protein [Nocardia sp. alder85J]|uniref:acyl-CoA dehydrogenase family protein n=1 Tax=Nocardia sp. alder85J TaxID=2862949 RepID=UPI001CD7FB4A|nr:acyl-CoA dehydrogenase family protein [Nocardia sp. alder85J]MCX4095751.1 acyl-CoA/acyl-ACP dehydrogenase [Nocardia sp. alder85J]
MVLSFTDEQLELRAVVRKFLESRSGESQVRAQMETPEGFDRQVWRQLAEQIGVQALAIPEEYGGAGFGFGELAVVLEESGRALLCAPLLSTVVLAANTLLLSGDVEACRDYLPGIAAGETIATLAVIEDSGVWAEDRIATSAIHTTDGWRLDGVKRYVLDGASADVVIVAARGVDGMSLFLVESGAHGVTIEDLPTLDRTRRQATVTLRDTPARLLGAVGTGWAVVSGVVDIGATALACEQVGGAARVLETTVDYLKVREQFGRPIGSFQAIKHRCSDMLVELESARSAAYYASYAVATDAADLPIAASTAKVYCSTAYYHIAAEGIQLHGGIGFTWEHPAHLYFKRAKGSEILLGTPAHHREVLAQRIGL